uniref:Uncharacterized protein n=1 Tax=Candidatus Kentrum sp. LFY TaxID=2126342 RepID=A0A450WWM5_9GAMM|nr:MAG: hypothetical protein BECKLFY1418C_GA0070996_10944 [Candidatus Kentron sp. LFY]
MSAINEHGVNKRWYDGMLSTEDWWAVWLGLIMFLAGMLSIWGLDLVGWMAKPKTWEWSAFWADPSWGKLLSVSHGKVGKAYEAISPFASLFITWLVFTGLTCIGAYFQRLDVKKFFFGFTCIFLITWTTWIAGHEAHFKALKTSQSITQPELYGDNVYCTTKVNKSAAYKSTRHLRTLASMSTPVRFPPSPRPQKRSTGPKMPRSCPGGCNWAAAFPTCSPWS